MAWKETPNSRSVRPNAELIRYHRKRLGWTQMDLAVRAGYGERVIRKAESGESIHADTLEILAETLCLPGHEVHPEDLISDPVAIAVRFMEAYKTKEAGMVVDVKSDVSEAIHFHMAGDPQEIQFAGNFYGLDGLDDLWSRFFAAFERPDKSIWRPTVYSNGMEVVLVSNEIVRVPGQQEFFTGTVWMQFVLERGKIVQVRDFYDTYHAARMLRDSKQAVMGKTKE